MVYTFIDWTIICRFMLFICQQILLSFICQILSRWFVWRFVQLFGWVRWWVRHTNYPRNWAFNIYKPVIISFQLARFLLGPLCSSLAAGSRAAGQRFSPRLLLNLWVEHATEMGQSCWGVDVVLMCALALCRGFAAVSPLLAVGVLARGRPAASPVLVVAKELLPLLIEGGVAYLRRYCRCLPVPIGCCGSCSRCSR